MCIALSSTAIECTWRPPDLNDYFILKYEITHKLAEGFDYYLNYGDIISSKNLTSETNELTTSGLNPYAGYVVTLSALTVSTSINGYNTNESGSILNETEPGPPLEVTTSKTSTAVITFSEGKAPTKHCVTKLMLHCYLHTCVYNFSAIITCARCQRDFKFKRKFHTDVGPSSKIFLERHYILQYHCH